MLNLKPYPKKSARQLPTDLRDSRDSVDLSCTQTKDALHPALISVDAAKLRLKMMQGRDRRPWRACPVKIVGQRKVSRR